MAKESIEQKAQRLFEGGAVEKVGENEYRVHGSTGEYTMRGGRCECPAFGRCSHAVAVELAQAAEREAERAAEEELRSRQVEVEVSIEEIRRVGERAAAAPGYYDGGLHVWWVDDPERVGLQFFEDEDYVADVIEGVQKGELRVTRTVTLAEGEERLALTATEQVALF